MEKITSNMLHCQTYADREGSYENPPAGSWKRRRMEALRRLGFKRVVLPSCAHGLSNLATGESWQKIAAWSSRVDLTPLVRPCRCLSHDVVQGCVENGPRKGELESNVAREYPAGLCTAMNGIGATRIKQDGRRA